MALIRQFHPVVKARNNVHEEVECSYAIFSEGGKRILQLDTYGSRARTLKGKVSQSVQFDRNGAQALKELIEVAFRDL